MRKRDIDRKQDQNTDPYGDKSKGKKVKYSSNQYVNSNIPVKSVMSRVLKDVTNSHDFPSPPPLTNESSSFQSPALSTRVFSGIILSPYIFTF